MPFIDDDKLAQIHKSLDEATAKIEEAQSLLPPVTPPSDDIIVNPGDNVQSILDTASAGARLLFQNSARYVVGTLHLTKPVTLQAMQCPDGRIPADYPVPVLASGYLDKTIDGTDSKLVTIKGLGFEARSNGEGEIIVLQDADTILLDKLLIFGGPNGQKRAIRGNGKNITLTDSYIANIWKLGQDSQCFCAWDGAGPYAIKNNFLEAASENIMFGGADNPSEDRIPSDIVISKNDFSKNTAWGKTGKNIKNLIEFKMAIRVLVSENHFAHCWTDGQTGYGWLIKSANQDGSNPWAVTKDVLFENNILEDSENGINIQGHDPNNPSGITTNIQFKNNLVKCKGTALQFGGGGVYECTHNTFENGYTLVSLYGPKVENFKYLNNKGNHNDYGVKGDGTGIGIPALNAFCTTWTFSQNLMLNRVPGRGGTYPPDNWFKTEDVPPGVVVGRIE